MIRHVPQDAQPHGRPHLEALRLGLRAAACGGAWLVVPRALAGISWDPPDTKPGTRVPPSQMWPFQPLKGWFRAMYPAPPPAWAVLDVRVRVK